MITTRYIVLSCLLFLHIPLASATNSLVDIKTNHGLIQVELFDDKAEKTVANFLKHVGNKFYDNRIFHRVIKGFMVQAGEPNLELSQQDEVDLTSIKLESTQQTGLTNKRGSITMARKSAPDSAVAQFFINTVDNDFLDYKNSRSPGYAVFGQVTKGMDVVDSIEKVKVGRGDLPKEPVTIESIRFHQEEPTTPPDSTNFSEVTKPELSFNSVESSYVVGDTVTIILNESDTQRKEEFDLWVAVKLPTGEFLYLSKKDTLSFTPVRFKNAVKADDNSYPVLDFTVPKGFTGIYTFYAIFNKIGADINDLDSSLRSNVAAIGVSLIGSTEEK